MAEDNAFDRLVQEHGFANGDEAIAAIVEHAVQVPPPVAASLIEDTVGLIALGLSPEDAGEIVVDALRATAEEQGVSDEDALACLVDCSYAVLLLAAISSPESFGLRN